MVDAQVSKTCGALNLMRVRLPPSALFLFFQPQNCGNNCQKLGQDSPEGSCIVLKRFLEDNPLFSPFTPDFQKEIRAFDQIGKN